MLTCVIRYDIDPRKHEAFRQYARAWNTAIPRAGAELIGYFAPHEGELCPKVGDGAIRRQFEVA
jgi:hypothetical protein